MGRRRGLWPYLFIGVREACRYRSGIYDVSLGDDRRRVSALLIAFANGREYGNGARLAPRARLDDGLIDAVIVEDRSVAARFWHAGYLVGGNADEAPLVSSHLITHAVVECDGLLDFHADGETGTAAGRVEVSVRPASLTVRVAASGSLTTSAGD
jgi:diacylglycerol kinase family enzyme